MGGSTLRLVGEHGWGTRLGNTASSCRRVLHLVSNCGVGLRRIPHTSRVGSCNAHDSSPGAGVDVVRA